MDVLILFLMSFASTAWADPLMTPVLLKQGFSSVLEFDEAPSRLVLGDPSAFQVERLEKSLVVKPTLPEAATNMFVYFEKLPARLFVLSASEDAKPVYYRKFESLRAPVAKPQTTNISASSGKTRLVAKRFSAKKDFLAVEVLLVATARAKITPKWSEARIRYKSLLLVPSKLHAERQEVQKNASVIARFEFAKPNLPADLRGAILVIPHTGKEAPITIELGGNR